MPQYPEEIFEPREIENMPGITYEESNKRTLYAEDFEALANEIIAIEEILGLNPEGDYDTVKEWLEALAGGGGGGGGNPFYYCLNLYGGTTLSTMINTFFGTGGSYTNSNDDGYSRVSLTATSNSNAIARSASPNGSFSVFSNKIVGGAWFEYSGSGSGAGGILFATSGAFEANGDVSANHIGFVIITVSGTSTLWATSGNGTQVKTNLGSYSGRKYVSIEFIPGVSIKFYVDGSLVATHITDLPTGEANNLLLIQARNVFGSAVTRSFTCFGSSVSLALP